MASIVTFDVISSLGTVALLVSGIRATDETGAISRFVRNDFSTNGTVVSWQKSSPAEWPLPRQVQEEWLGSTVVVVSAYTGDDDGRPLQMQVERIALDGSAGDGERALAFGLTLSEGYFTCADLIAGAGAWLWDGETITVESE